MPNHYPQLLRFSLNVEVIDLAHSIFEVTTFEIKLPLTILDSKFFFIMTGMFGSSKWCEIISKIAFLFIINKAAFSNK